MDKGTGQRPKTAIHHLGTIIACLGLVPLTTSALAHTETTQAPLHQAEPDKQARTVDLQRAHSFNIPSGSLNVALTDFSGQSRTHVVLSGVPSDVLSPGVSGDLSTLNALTALLHGTGMSFRQVNANTLVVAPLQRARLRPTQFQFADALADQPTTAAAPAAGAPAAPESALQEVTVSASAISIAGYQAPTPVTAIGIQQLQSAAQPEIGDTLRQMPMIQGETAENGSTGGDVSDNLGGVNNVNLRNLGVNRTLVLFDGQRVVQVSNQGGVDSTLIPTSLVERIDIVTGGASATYGSDAVAGVVNLIINKNFNGVMANAMYSNNAQGLFPQQRADITLGTPFAGGRGHIEVAGSLFNSPTFYDEQWLPGWNSPALVVNPACTNYSGINAKCPAGQNIWQAATGVGWAQATPGGLITGPLAGQPAIPQLTGIAFGPEAQPYSFNCGHKSENVTCYGGQANYQLYNAQSAPLKSYTGFGLMSFRVSDALQASLQLNYARTSVETQLNNLRQLGTIPIYSGNPYIPASIQAALTAQNVPGFMLGNINNGYPGATSYQAEETTVGDNVFWNYRTLQRGVFTLDGSLGPKWTWKAYYMTGQNHLLEVATYNPQVANLSEAENAVLVTPAINAAVPSLQIGSATCAANVPLNLLPGGATGLVAQHAIYPGALPGCVPVNVIGYNTASPAALAYLNSAAANGGDADNNTVKESVASGSVQGELPFGLAAPIAAAAGLLWRSERISGHNCGVECDTVQFHGGNFVNNRGYYNIKEASAEVNVPVLKDKWVRDLSFDAAARLSDYSTSGSVETYKFGVVSQLTDWMRFRGSYSVDIRAPDLYELYELPQTESQGTQVDPRTGILNNLFTLKEGNTNLIPEDAETRTFGFVFTPIPGMNLSIDWYFIELSNVIDLGFSYQQDEQECAAGAAAFCQLLIFGHYPTNYCIGSTLTSCPNSLPLSDYIQEAINANTETNSGLDFNGDYRVPFAGGTLDFNAAMNYTFEQRLTVPLVGTIDSLNSLGGDEARYNTSTGPDQDTTTKFHGTVAVTYAQGPWLGTAQTRMIGAAWQVSQWINTNYISNHDNAIPFIAYLDLRLSYDWSNGLTLYSAIDNALGKKAPAVYSTAAQSNGPAVGIKGDIYDSYGLRWRVGVRYRFGG